MAQDELDRSYPASNVHEIHIEPSLPLLEMRMRRDGESETVSFLIGERGDLLLRLINRGTLPIADVDVRIQPVFVQNSEQRQITYYSEEELKAEQNLSTAKQPSIPPSSSFSSAAPSPALRTTSSTAPAAVPTSAQLPASLSFSSSTAAKRVFDFARSVTQSRKQSLTDSAPPSPTASQATVRPAASALPPTPLIWSAKDVAAVLPLLPGQHVEIPVHVNAISEWSARITHSDPLRQRSQRLLFPSSAPLASGSCGLEYTVCYAADKSDRSYRVAQDQLRWEVLPSLACKHVAVLSALQHPITPSAALPSLPLHLLLDIANRADIDLMLHIDIVEPTSRQSHSDQGNPVKPPSALCLVRPVWSRFARLSCVVFPLPNSVSAVSQSTATRIRRRSDRR